MGVFSGVAAFGGVVAFYLTFITYTTTDDTKVITLLSDRRPGWAIIVSIIAYCFMIVFSVILISCRNQTFDLEVKDNELTPRDEGVRAEGAYEIVDDALMAEVNQAEDISIETYENPSTEVENDETPVAGKDEPGESMKEMWEEASRKKEELERELKEKMEEELRRQQEEDLDRQRQQEEAKTSELIYCLSEVDEKPRELEENNDMLQIQTKDEEVVSTVTLRGDEELEEEAKPCEDRQEEVASGQSKEEEKSSTDIADDRLNAKVLIPECPSMESLKKKKKKKKKMKLCCNS